jgi:uncharacterized protein
MTSVQPWHRAIVLSTLDLPDGQDLLVYSCEDCACAVSERHGPGNRGQRSHVDIGSQEPWVNSTETAEIQLPRGYRLLFNPLGCGGAVVVNEPAHGIYRSFDRPVSLRDVRSAGPGKHDVDAAIRRLGQLDMIHPEGKPPSPEFANGEVLTAWLHVTNDCNLRCPYCYVDKSPEGMDESTGYAAVDAVIRSALAHGFPAVKLKYAGGEASLNHRLLTKLHDRARSLAAQNGLHLYATLLSNGVMLPSSLIETLREERIRVMISLDGVGETHDLLRLTTTGRPTFRLVERTINQLIDQQHPPHLSITITGRNSDGVADAVRFALERNLTFSLNFFRESELAADFPDLRYEEQAMISGLLSAFRVIEEFLPRWSVLGSVLDRGQLLQPRQRSCGVGQDYVVIDQRGQVAKCHMEIERTLGDVYSSDPLQLVRRDQATVMNLAVEEKEGCRGCVWRYWCTGGCAVATFRATGRYDIKSPNCNIYRAIYPEALRLEGLRLLKYATRASPELPAL